MLPLVKKNTRFRRLPVYFLAFLSTIIVVYIVTVEAAKRIFYEKMEFRNMAGNVQDKREHLQKITHLARIVLVTFLLTFMLARVIVFLVMFRTIPDFFLHIKGTHVHHLNYGIFLLSAVGVYLLFWQPVGKRRRITAGIYGVAMALTFDEFGMWIHLGGSYWQRASWDAVVVISGVLALIAFSVSIRRLRPRHWLTAIILLLAMIIFVVLFIQSFKYAGEKLGPKLKTIESTAPG